MHATASAVLSVLDAIFIHYRNKVLKVSPIEIGFCFTPKLAVLRVQLNTNRKLEVANWLKKTTTKKTHNNPVRLSLLWSWQTEGSSNHLPGPNIFYDFFQKWTCVIHLTEWILGNVPVSESEKDLQTLPQNQLLLCFYLHQCLYLCPSHSSTLATSFIWPQDVKLAHLCHPSALAVYLLGWFGFVLLPFFFSPGIIPPVMVSSSLSLL